MHAVTRQHTSTTLPSPHLPPAVFIEGFLNDRCSEHGVVYCQPINRSKLTHADYRPMCINLRRRLHITSRLEVEVSPVSTRDFSAVDLSPVFTEYLFELSTGKGSQLYNQRQLGWARHTRFYYHHQPAISRHCGQHGLVFDLILEISVQYHCSFVVPLQSIVMQDIITETYW